MPESDEAPATRGEARLLRGERVLEETTGGVAFDLGCFSALISLTTGDRLAIFPSLARRKGVVRLGVCLVTL